MFVSCTTRYCGRPLKITLCMLYVPLRSMLVLFFLYISVFIAVLVSRCVTPLLSFRQPIKTRLIGSNKCKKFPPSFSPAPPSKFHSTLSVCVRCIRDFGFPPSTFTIVWRAQNRNKFPFQALSLVFLTFLCSRQPFDDASDVYSSGMAMAFWQIANRIVEKDEMYFETANRMAQMVFRPGQHATFPAMHCSITLSDLGTSSISFRLPENETGFFFLCSIVRLRQAAEDKYFILYAAESGWNENEGIYCMAASEMNEAERKKWLETNGRANCVRSLVGWQ